MEHDKEIKISTTNEHKHWYTEEFVSLSVSKYLKENGYKIHKEDTNSIERRAGIIIASKYFTKEIIQVKGIPKESNRSKLLKEAVNDTYPSSSILTSFTDTLFNSLINFGRYYSDDNSETAMALPGVGRFTSIIEKLHEYFITNNLSMKVYLVNESGKVEVSNLNGE